MNKKIEKTKKSLWDALYNLLSNKALEQISVSELCQTAGINRTTFYKYYNVPADVLSEYLQDHIETMLYGIARENQPLQARLLKICREYWRQKDFLKVFFSCSAAFLPTMQEQLQGSPSHDLRETGYHHFISGGVYSIIRQWILYEDHLSPEDVATILNGFIIKLE